MVWRTQLPEGRSCRDSSPRRRRNEDGSIPEASPECTQRRRRLEHRPPPARAAAPSRARISRSIRPIPVTRKEKHAIILGHLLTVNTAGQWGEYPAIATTL